MQSRGSRGRNLRALLDLLRPYRLRVAAMLFALVLGTAASLAPPLLARLAIDKGIEQHDPEALVCRCDRVPGLGAAGVGHDLRRRPTSSAGSASARSPTCASASSRTCSSQPIGFYESRPAGVLISRITNDVEALESLVTDSVVTLFQSGLTLIGAIGVLLYLDRKLALITFCVVPFVLGGSIWFRLVSAGAFRRTRETIGAITAYLQETLSGIRVVRSFGQEPRHQATFAAAQRGQLRRQHGDRASQRHLLPGGGNALRRRAGGDRALWRLPGDRRAHHRRHRRGLRGHPLIPL